MISPRYKDVGEVGEVPWPVGDILRSSFFFMKISYFDKMPSK